MEVVGRVRGKISIGWSTFAGVVGKFRMVKSCYWLARDKASQME